MLKLNLLPPKEKKELELAELNRLAVSLAFRFLIILIIFVLLLANTYFCLSILIKAQKDLIEIRQSDKEAQHQTEFEEKIKQINREAKQIYAKQNNLIVWTPILEKLSKSTPQGVYLINFSYQASNNQIKISGWAKNRDRLLAFENSLKEVSYFEEVQSPLSNLIKQADINFSFTLKPVVLLSSQDEIEESD
jgi:Tfp pilus assembly protein PilN